MADEQDQPEEELLLDEPLEGDEPDEQDEGDQPEPANDDDGDEFAIEIEGDEAPEEETALVKHLRRVARDAQKEAADLRKVNTPKIEVGPEPDLWDDCEGDPDKYKTALLAWTDRKEKRAKQDEDDKSAAQNAQQHFQRKFVNYRAKAAALPVKDFEEAEKTVISTLPEKVQSALIEYIDDSAKVVYALGTHPTQLARIADEPDPIRALLMIHDMGKSLKVVNKRKPPAPEAETIVTGSSQGNPSKERERLEKQAKGGDRSALIAWKAKQRAAGKAA